MKNLKIYLSILVMSSLSLTAQNKDTADADKLFAKYEFVEAIEAYNKLVEKGKGDAYVYGQLAEANYNIFSTTEAERWYAKALESSNDPEMMYKYSQMLKANGKYDESNNWMAKFAAAKPNDDRAKAFTSNKGYISGILEESPAYTLTSLDFNSEQSDFGGTVLDGTVYFASARNTARRDYGWNEEPFLDVYQVAKGSDGTYQEASQVNGSINTKHHEGLVTFSPDGNTMYFSRESFYEGDYQKNKDLKTKFSVIYLFMAKKDGDKWGRVEALPFNSQEYSVKNPSLSADGSTLYFASDMPGGFGKYDIYKVAVNADGSFGEPENLGNKVNTEDQEMFPYISSNGTLYFSSTGHLGLGGLDVFSFKDGKVTNAGVPVNSNSDDLAFTINEDSGEGFVSSNRAGGKGGDDVYALTRIEPCNVVVVTTVVDGETGNPLAGATVTIMDSKEQVVKTATTGADGKVEYTVSCEKSLVIKGKMDDFESNSINFVGSKEKQVDLQLMLNPIDEIIVADRVVLNPILFDFDKANITSQGAFELDKLVAVMKKYPDMVIKAESHTDSRGSARYNEQLSDRRAKSTVQYVISKGIEASRISGVGKGENEPAVDCGGKCTEEQHQTNRRSEFIIVSGGPSQE